MCLSQIHELQLLFEGEPNISIEDWRANTTILHECVVFDNFFEVLQQLPSADRQRVLAFTTGSPCLPPGGFAKLSPRISLHLGDKGPNVLPTSHTCYNALVLQAYPSTEVLKIKLMQAVQETGLATFGMR
jgi:hypothetical protein